MAKQKLIPAVAYLRKSTKGTKADGKERQEKSIGQQRTEIEKLAKAQGFTLVREYSDEGKSGWKRGAARPGFAQMMNDAQSRGDFTAIICDDVDRFSRADVNEVQSDAYELKKVGVQFIVTVAQGVYDLGSQGHDIGKILKFIVDVWGSNQFSRKLSRRMTLSLRSRADEGKRAAVAPYGFVNDGKSGLKHGNRKHIAVVRRIFTRFVSDKQSMNQIVSELNAEGIPSPRGAKWYVDSLRKLMQRPAYRGDFAYGRGQRGRFFTTAKDGEVIESGPDMKPWKMGEPVVLTKQRYKPIVPPKVWDAAQRRIESFSMSGSRRPRKDGYPLSGILICDHCGGKMFGCQQKGRPHRLYVCSTPAKTGQGSCPSGGAPTIREELILPHVLKMLGEEIADMRHLLTNPPEEMIAPGRERQDQREARKAERDELARKIERAADNVVDAPDRDTAQLIYKKIAELRSELSLLDAGLDVTQEPDYRREELQALVEWWNDFNNQAVSVPVEGGLAMEAWFNRDPESVEAGTGIPTHPDGLERVLVDARVVNEALRDLGAEVRLRWKNEPVVLGNGDEQNRFGIIGGRFRLGQKSGKISGKDGVSFYNSPAAGRCTSRHGADHCDSRTGRG